MASHPSRSSTQQQPNFSSRSGSSTASRASETDYYRSQSSDPISRSYVASSSKATTTTTASGRSTQDGHLPVSVIKSLVQGSSSTRPPPSPAHPPPPSANGTAAVTTTTTASSAATTDHLGASAKSTQRYDWNKIREYAIYSSDDEDDINLDDHV